MPWDIKYQPNKPPRGRPWKLINKETGKQVGSSKTRSDAVKSRRARGMGHFRKKRKGR